MSLSLALYTGLAAHILNQLQVRLHRENLEDMYNSDKLNSFRRCIASLLKASGKSNTDMDLSQSIQICLDSIFAVGTNQPKKPLPPPESHNLGLLCDKFCYESPTIKAEQAVLHGKEFNSVDFSETPPPTAPKLTNVDYINGQQSVDALSLVFGMQEFMALTEEKPFLPTSQLPIGFKLLNERASHQIGEQDYREHSVRTSKLASQWMTVLLEWTKKRSHPRQKRVFDTTTEQNTRMNEFNDHTPVTKKQRSYFFTDTKEATSHKCCSVKGWKHTGLDTKLIRVPDYPPPLPSNASEKRQVTYHKKVFIQAERTKRMGLGRDYG